MAYRKQFVPPRGVSSSWWKGLSLELKIAIISLAFVVLTFIAAALVVPEIRHLLHLQSETEERTTEPKGTPQSGTPESQPPKQKEPERESPAKPKLRYVPLPGAVPLDEEHKQLLTSSQTGEEIPRKTVFVDGKMYPVLNSNDIDKILLRKEPTGFIKLNQNEDVQLYVGIDKDGKVETVQVLSGDQTTGEKAADAVKQWKFKPFVENGDRVAVQTVIDIEGKPEGKIMQKVNPD